MSLTLARIQELSIEIESDCKADIERMEGLPLTGSNVAEGFGNTLAMVAALAKIVGALAREIEEVRP